MQENTQANNKLFFKSIAKVLKKKTPVIIFGAAVGGALFCSATAAPVVIAAGAVAAGAVGYAQYKKENPKASFLHFAKNTLKNKRNQIHLHMQNKDVYQAIARVREKRSTVGDEVTNIAANALTLGGIKGKHADNKPILTEKAQKASRLNRIKIMEIIDEAKREL